MREGREGGREGKKEERSCERGEKRGGKVGIERGRSGEHPRQSTVGRRHSIQQNLHPLCRLSHSP